MNILDQIRTELAAMRGGRAAARARLERAAATLADAPDDAARAAIRAEVAQLRLDVDALREREMAAGVPTLDPRQFIQALEGNVPILLLPLRVQTRLVEDDGRRLLVRVFPDDVSVQAHDPVLTAGERAMGAQFWAAPEAGDDPATPTRPAIWRGIVTRAGLRRAAWIVRAADPDAPVSPDVAPASLRVPAVWTLPERLVFRFVRTGFEPVLEVLGAPIPDGLEMGVDQTREALGFTRADGDFDYPPELRWQVDFDEAVRVGMGVRVPLDALGGAQTLALVEVLGVRLSTDAPASAVLVEQLVESHRYTDGFSILPQGTPTNVTGEADAPAPDNPDAALAWLSGDGAFTDGGLTTKYEDECDGLRLAHALGIAPAAMRYVDRADRRDGGEAIAMKRALWAGTLGYYAQQMLWPLFASDDAATAHRGERLTAAARFHFTHFVFGRGPLPAIRVGDQPYGVLPVSADMLARGESIVGPWNEPGIDAFEVALRDKLLVLAPAWHTALDEVARAGPGPDADRRLVEALSLQASAAEYHGERLVGLAYIEDYVDFTAKGVKTSFDEYRARLAQRHTEFDARFPTLFAGIPVFAGPGVPSSPRVFDLSFFGANWKEIAAGVLALDRARAPVLSGDVVDDLPYSESRGIGDAYPNYLDKLATLPFADVKRGVVRLKDGATVPVTALLYLLARYSYLYEHAAAAMRLQHHLQGKPWSAFAERELYNAGFMLDATYWDLMDEPARWLALGTGRAVATPLQLVTGREALRATVGEWTAYFGDVDQQQRAFAQLATLPTARLERLFGEHVDLAGYRLDAWVTGFVYQRLLAIRAWREDLRGDRVHPAHPEGRPRGAGPPLRYDLNHRPLAPYATGIFLGAYGWAEGITPDAAPTLVNDLPADLAPRNGGPVVREPGNVGLVQAPSLNQATTAAVLRAASVSEPDTTAFNIDLSSARVRDALWVVDGVRNGQPPAALLGYQLERALRDRDVTLLRYLPALRTRFPMPRVVEEDAALAESLPARDVVNGLRMVQALRDGAGDESLGAKLAFMDSDADRAAVTVIAAKLLDTLDACSDLMLAESVHQAALGNYDRAGGIVTAAGEFQHVPDEFEVIRTPRSGTSLTHRVLLAMNDAPPAAAPSTPRARLAPALDAWVGQLVGPLSDLGVVVAYTFRVDDVATVARHAVTLDALGLAPLDLLYVLDESAAGELAERADAVARAAFVAAHPDAAVEGVEVELFADVPAGVRAAGELVPLLTSLRALVTIARPATQRDFVPPQVLHARPPEAVDAIDLPELAGRASDLQLAFEAALADLEAAAGLGADALRAALLAAAAFGVPQAVPNAAASPDALTKQADRAAAEMRARLDAVAAKWTRPVPPAANTLATLGEVATALLGAAVPLMPRILLADDVASVELAPGDPTPERVEDWLFTASAVREDAARLQHARVLADATASPLAPLRVFQWPADQRRWVADPNALPAERVRDYVAVVVQPAGADAAAPDLAQPVVGLVVDEWHELVPNTTETTGISFHYDAPNAEPPQSLLLAVSQRSGAGNGNWTWDELTRCLGQTLALAKLRLVGPDQLRRTPLDAVLPATYGAEAATPATISTSLFSNISTTVAQHVHAIWSQT